MKYIRDLQTAIREGLPPCCGGTNVVWSESEGSLVVCESCVRDNVVRDAPKPKPIELDGDRNRRVELIYRPQCGGSQPWRVALSGDFDIGCVHMQVSEYALEHFCRDFLKRIEAARKVGE